MATLPRDPRNVLIGLSGRATVRPLGRFDWRQKMNRRLEHEALTSRPRSQRTAAERAERQSRLLDQALLETFPASDPVSVALVT